ncbi:MAG: hypothetical protein J6A28_03365 [Clostridia bacterium]|nr:hypothetical protein [Clostridia bacterium]
MEMIITVGKAQYEASARIFKNSRGEITTNYFQDDTLARSEEEIKASFQKMTGKEVFGVNYEKPMKIIAAIATKIKAGEIDPKRLYAKIKNQEVDLTNTNEQSVDFAGNYTIAVELPSQIEGKSIVDSAKKASAEYKIDEAGEMTITDASTYNPYAALYRAGDVSTDVDKVKENDVFNADYRDVLPLLSLIAAGITTNKISPEKLKTFIKANANELAYEEDEASL